MKKGVRRFQISNRTALDYWTITTPLCATKTQLKAPYTGSSPAASQPAT